MKRISYLFHPSTRQSIVIHISGDELVESMRSEYVILFKMFYIMQNKCFLFVSMTESDHVSYSLCGCVFLK